MSNFTVAAVFSNNMVLQRNKPIFVFGQAENETKITVELFSATSSVLASNTVSAANGLWELKLAPQSAQDGCTLKVCSQESDSTYTFTNIAIGEVWLAGGQSNMEFELQNCVEAQEALALSGTDSPNVRFYYTNKIGWKDDHFFEAERNTCWQTWESEGKKSWSAVGFFFAQKLAKDLGCTVGLIGCNWGGTSASAWMRKEFLEADTNLNTYLTEYAETTAGKTIEQQLKEYDDYEIENAKWQEGYGKLWQKDHAITWEQAEKILGKNPWPGPKSCKNPYRPTGLYDCMLSRILPYTLKGVIWYQGESDDHKPNMYYDLFAKMIQNWREDFEDEDLPFVFVQLPCHRYEADPDFKHWCLIREAQAKVHNNIKNAFMTVALDLGKFSDIHPTAKKEIGQRMETVALEKVYGQNIKSISPLFQSFYAQGNKIILSFTNAEEGFILRDDEKELNEYKKMEQNQGTPVPADFTGFEIAGADGIFYPANFELGTGSNLNTITVSSPKVQEPKAARYAWFNYGPVTVFGKSGLPLAPFRTNPNVKLSQINHAKTQQIMTV